MNIRWPGWLWVSVLVPAMIGATVTLCVLAGRAALEGRPIALNDLLSAVAVGVVLGAISAAVPFVVTRRIAKSAAFAQGTYEVPRGQSIERPREERFDKFDDAARGVLTHAQKEATRLGHNYLGTEHLLLGILAETESAASRVLRSRGVDLTKARTAVDFIVGRGGHEVRGEIGLTPRSKHVIQLAIDEARRLGDGFIGSEHILLGLLREGEGIAAGVLESFGVDLERLREDVLRLRPTGGHASEA
jgi:hypothetical protein